MKPIKTIYCVCEYLRGACKHCKPTVESPYGRGEPGCYGVAREVVNVVRHGNPFGKRRKRA